MTDTDMKTENMIYKTAPWKRAYDSSQAQIGIQILEYCRNQLFLSYPSFDQALFILQWEADDRIAGIGTDGVKISIFPCMASAEISGGSRECYKGLSAYDPALYLSASLFSGKGAGKSVGSCL